MNFLQPHFLLAVIPLLLLLYWLLFTDFLKKTKRFKDDDESQHKQKKFRVWMSLSRTLVVLLLVAALADPFIEDLAFEEVEPRLLVLQDVSASMDLLNTQEYDEMIDALKDHIVVREQNIGQASAGTLGDDVLTYLTQGENILLVTDGNSQLGADLSEVALFASSINATIGAVELDVLHEDSAIRIEGPSQAIADSNVTYYVHISSTHADLVSVKVSIDDVILFDAVTPERVLPITQSLSEGEHTITAELTSEDYFSENNKYVKTVSVVEKPRILHVTRKQSGLDTLLDTLYTVDRQAALPSDLENYYAVVLEDLASNTIGQMDVLRTYLEKGNGLIVVGGENSFDKGNYAGSVFETLLPVRIGTGKREKGDANIALAIDMSGSTGTTVVFKEARRTTQLATAPRQITLEYAVPGLDIDTLLFTKDKDYSPTGRDHDPAAGVWVEAEDAELSGSGFFSGIDPYAGGQGYLSTQPKEQSQEKGAATLTVMAPESGAYYMWARVRTHGGSEVSSRTIYVGAQDGRQRWAVEQSNKWVWRQITDPGQKEAVNVTSTEQALQKSLAISVLQDLHPGNAVGVLGFTYPLPGRTDQACSGACVVHPVQQIGKDREIIREKIARVNITGNTALWIGMEGAVKLLERTYGSMNIILITDGVTNQDDQDKAVEVAKAVAARGGRVYTIQVGDDERGRLALLDVARNGNGIFFSAERKNSLTVLFGEPGQEDAVDSFSVVTLNQHHFITQGIEPTGTLYGYNQVVPKHGSQLLVTSGQADPIITVWNFGVGRVATITGFNGPNLGELLRAPDSKLLSRTVNWAIADPQRKESYSLFANDAYLQESASLVVHSEQVPEAEGLVFTPVTKDIYSATLHTESTGVFSVLGTQYAVNYNRELSRVGYSEDLSETLELANGEIFSMQDVEEIVSFAQTKQLQTQSQQLPIRWPFLLAALFVLLVEIVIRRITELRKNR